jgi:XFP N-terminal domain
MILAGDEFGRTQSGNNNAYCQDNESSWVDWHLLEANADLFRFFRLLIQFRQNHWLLRREEYDLHEADRTLHIAWHGAELGPCYLEGTYSEIFPDKSLDEEGLQRFFKQFSFPGGVGSHCTPETPGSIHEGGELGYSVSPQVQGVVAV